MSHIPTTQYIKKTALKIPEIVLHHKLGYMALQLLLTQLNLKIRNFRN